MKEGSELMGRGLSRRAVGKYKTALDMIQDHLVEVRKHESCKFSSKLWICYQTTEFLKHRVICRKYQFVLPLIRNG
jgi:hypothetical protein